MRKDDPDALLEPVVEIRITHVPRDDVRRPAQRCAEMTLRAMREKSKTARKGYEAAARAFAMATKEEARWWEP